MELYQYVSEYLREINATSHCRAALNALQRFIQDKGTDIESLSSDDIYELVTASRASNELVIKRYRNELIKFFSWLEAKGLNVESGLNYLRQNKIEKATEAIGFDPTWYYGDYRSMIEAFETFARRTEINDPSTHATILTLAWFGVPKTKVLNIKMEDVVSTPDAFEIKNLVKIRNPIAMRVLEHELHSYTYQGVDGRTWTKEKNGLFVRPIQFRYLVTASRNTDANDSKFEYSKVAASAMYAKAYDVLDVLGIPITMDTHLRHPYVVGDLLKLTEKTIETGTNYWNKYIVFYEWCKTFRKVHD